MKIYLLVATLLQLTLLSFSKYYDSIANGVLKSAVEIQGFNLLSSLDKFQYYSDLDDYLGYVSATIWVMVVVVTKLKNVSSSNMANLAICLPLLFHMVLMAI